MLSFAIFFFAREHLYLPLANLQTLIFVMLVFSGQGMVYLVRERHHFWKSRPSRWLLMSSIADILIVGFLATRGILMAPISLRLVGATLAGIAGFLVLVDFIKVRIVKRFGLL